MSAFSDDLEYLIAQQTFRGTASVNASALVVASAGPFIRLWTTTALTDTGGASAGEVSTTGGYAAVQVPPTDWTVTTSGTITAKNAAVIQFADNASGASYTVNGWSAWRSSAGYGQTDLLYHGTTSAGVTVANGDRFEFAASALTVTFH